MMRRTNVYLDEDQLRHLKHLAAENGETVSKLIRSAIDRFVDNQAEAGADWRARFDALIQRARSRVPSTITPAEIEADVTAARSESRKARRARRR
jgi:predicted transcriptional regulator